MYFCVLSGEDLVECHWPGPFQRFIGSDAEKGKEEMMLPIYET